MSYIIKQIPQDFVVHEVSLLPSVVNRNKAKYTYVYIEKIGYTTFEVQKFLALRFDIDIEDVSFQGLKDEDGLTIQLFSIKKILTKQDARKIKSRAGTYYTIKSIFGYGKDPVANKALHGNSFIVTIRNLSDKETEKMVKRCENKHFSFINYYDEQRFGKPNSPHNTHLIGKSLVKRDYSRAKKEYIISGNELPNIKSRESEKDFFELIPKNFLFFIISSYNSYLWNIAASTDIEKIYIKKTYFKNVGTLHLPTDSVFSVKNMCTCDGYSIDDNLNVTKRKIDRPLTANTSIYVNEVARDELNAGKQKIALSFFLPTGSYATMAIKQLILQAQAI